MHNQPHVVIIESVDSICKDGNVDKSSDDGMRNKQHEGKGKAWACNTIIKTPSLYIENLLTL